MATPATNGTPNYENHSHHYEQIQEFVVPETPRANNNSNPSNPVYPNAAASAANYDHVLRPFPGGFQSNQPSGFAGNPVNSAVPMKSVVAGLVEAYERRGANAISSPPNGPHGAGNYPAALPAGSNRIPAVFSLNGGGVGTTTPPASNPSANVPVPSRVESGNVGRLVSQWEERMNPNRYRLLPTSGALQAAPVQPTAPGPSVGNPAVVLSSNAASSTASNGLQSQKPSDFVLNPQPLPPNLYGSSSGQPAAQPSNDPRPLNAQPFSDLPLVANPWLHNDIPLYNNPSPNSHAAEFNRLVSHPMREVVEAPSGNAPGAQANGTGAPWVVGAQTPGMTNLNPPPVAVSVFGPVEHRPQQSQNQVTTMRF